MGTSGVYATKIPWRVLCNPASPYFGVYSPLFNQVSLYSPLANGLASGPPRSNRSDRSTDRRIRRIWPRAALESEVLWAEARLDQSRVLGIDHLGTHGTRIGVKELRQPPDLRQTPTIGLGLSGRGRVCVQPLSGSPMTYPRPPLWWPRPDSCGASRKPSYPTPCRLT